MILSPERRRPTRLQSRFIYAFGYGIGYTEGRKEVVRSFILRQAGRRFGPPAPHHEAALAAVADLSALRVLSDRLLDVATWDELLAAG